MICGEAYLLCNFGLCACALPLGGKLAGLPAPPWKRLLAAAAIGGALALWGMETSCWMLLLGLPLCVWICFSSQGWQACVRCSITTFGASLVTGGGVSMLLQRQTSPWMSLTAAMAASWLVYLLVSLLPGVIREVQQVELTVGERSVLLPAMLDNGNLLRDSITGLPVLVVPWRAMTVLFPQAGDWMQPGQLPPGFRLLNVRTAAGGGLLPLFRPDLCRLYVRGRRWETELLVAAAGREYDGVQALVPLAALPPGALSGTE